MDLRTVICKVIFEPNPMRFQPDHVQWGARDIFSPGKHKGKQRFSSGYAVCTRF